MMISLLPLHLVAQISPEEVTVDSTKAIVLTLTDGSQLQGEILSVTDTELELQKQAGRIFVRLDRIEVIHTADPDAPLRRWFKNPNTSRLFVSPTARPLQKGQGYYQNVYIFISGLSYGITDNFSVTGGISMLPGVRISNQLFFGGARFGGAVSENHYFSAGAVAATAGGADSALYIGFGNYTYAHSRGSFTTGITTFSVMDDVGAYSILLGMDYRFSQRIAFVTENHVFPQESATVLSYGLRFMGEQMSVDLAFLQPGAGINVGFGIPFLDFVFNF
ncbi:hypothetical protein DYD21_16100 [Rhodohalobacter sp. SW132]|nr:hypothetical protein DYD21_16100 [Rhodohalobacter sp. SW132]